MKEEEAETYKTWGRLTLWLWQGDSPYLGPGGQCHYLDDMQFGQEVAISQSQMVSIQEFPLGDGDVLHTVLVNLLWERSVQVDIQALKLPQQGLLKIWEGRKPRVVSGSPGLPGKL